MDCKTMNFSRHAFERMFQRGIDPDAVAQVIAEGVVIADYPDDQPFPSVLLLGFDGRQPVHAVVARELATGNCHLVTIYLPDPAIWDESFKRRKV
ncbi:MAG: DUF4258 domain-containing protein [Gallionella sp.]|nr:DUF4258 domain-containing protein [Gallionella sp.]